MKKNNFQIIFYSFCIVTTLISILSQDILAHKSDTDFSNYIIRSWTIESGLPQNTINALVQTHDGYVWIGTPSGLARFDGVKTTIFNRWNTPHLTNDRILALYEDINQRLWIGTDGGGLYLYDKGRWKNYSTKNGLSNNHVQTITGDWDGNIWVGTEYGLNRIYQENIKVFTKQNGLYDNNITALATDNWHNLWIGTYQGGLAKFKYKILKVYDYNDGLINMSVSAIQPDRFGNIWTGTLEGLFIKKQEEELIRPVHGALYSVVTSLTEDKNGSIWLSTMTDGVRQIIHGSISGFACEENLPDNYVRCTIEDTDGNLWIGMDAGGIVQVKNRTVQNITNINKLPINDLCALLVDEFGVYWVGTKNNGLYKINNEQVLQKFDKNTGLTSNRISVIFKDKNKNIWIGTEDSGVNKLNNGKITQFNTEDSMSSNHVTSIIEDDSGGVLIATDRGLNRFYAGKIQTVGGDLHIRTLIMRRDNTLLLGTKTGLYNFSDGVLAKQVQNFYGSPVDILSLFEDSDGILWIGTNGNGLMRWSSNNLLSCTTENGLPDNYIFSITEDQAGNLWMSSFNGVFKIKRKELNTFFENRINSIIPTHYTETEGMSSRQCIREVQPAVWNDAGKLYYPTVKGISIFNVENLRPNTKPPRIIIEEILADNIPCTIKDKITLTSATDNIDIYFTAIDFSAPEKIHFKFKLEGHEDNFFYLKQGTERVVRYSDLNPGKYKFILIAANNNGLWDQQGTSFEFEIEFPFYRQSLFYLISAIFLSLISMGIIYYRRRLALKKSRNKYKTSALDPGRAEQTMPRLLQLLENEKIYLDPDLTLKDLSGRLNIHYNHLSRIINERFELSYNDFINRYRIEEAKCKFSNPEFKDKTVLELMYECGFYSKSVFNTAFKKFTGMTPSEFRKKQL